MSIIRDIADAIRLLRELIENTRSIVKAINDGREFLARNHPEASDDFAALLNQMQTTIEGLARVTGVVQSFRFTVGSSTATERSVERFNEHVTRHHEKVTKLRGSIRKLKNDCEKIRKLRDKLNEQSKSNDWSALFGLIGMRNGRKRQGLASTLSNFYADDQRMIEVIEGTLELAERALDDVDQSLGPSGRADPYNVPRAAQMLGIYSDMFKEPNKMLQILADEMSWTSNSLVRD